MNVTNQVAQFGADMARIRSEVAKTIVGHRDIVDGLLTCLLCGGHALLEGVPGLGKTLLVKSLGAALHLQFSRIQFTPDLMPADIIGTRVVLEDEAGQRHFAFQPGPIFSNVVLADEINRATPKTQSALLEAMQEQTVTVAGTEHKLQAPFLVLATQNPLEMDGTRFRRPTGNWPQPSPRSCCVDSRARASSAWRGFYGLETNALKLCRAIGGGSCPRKPRCWMLPVGAGRSTEWAHRSPPAATAGRFCRRSSGLWLWGCRKPCLSAKGCWKEWLSNCGARRCWRDRRPRSTSL